MGKNDNGFKLQPEVSEPRVQPPKSEEINSENGQPNVQPQQTEIVYHTLDDIPAGARPAVKAAINKRGIDGNKVLTPDETGNLNVSESLLRIIVMCYRAGLYQ